MTPSSKRGTQLSKENKWGLCNLAEALTAVSRANYFSFDLISTLPRMFLKEAALWDLLGFP